MTIGQCRTLREESSKPADRRSCQPHREAVTASAQRYAEYPTQRRVSGHSLSGSTAMLWFDAQFRGAFVTAPARP
jgi:hypothetical protein